MVGIWLATGKASWVILSQYSSVEPFETGRQVSREVTGVSNMTIKYMKSFLWLLR